MSATTMRELPALPYLPEKTARVVGWLRRNAFELRTMAQDAIGGDAMEAARETAAQIEASAARLEIEHLRLDADPDTVPPHLLGFLVERLQAHLRVGAQAELPLVRHRGTAGVDWVPVADAVPEFGEVVWATCLDDARRRRFVTAVHWSPAGARTYLGGDPVDVIAWMEAPAPYEKNSSPHAADQPAVSGTTPAAGAGSSIDGARDPALSIEDEAPCPATTTRP